MSKTRISFPIGFHNFHKKQAFNFQLNRFHAVGLARFEDMEQVGKEVGSIGDWKTQMLKQAELAIAEGRLINASTYYRAAEFYLKRSDPDKELLYEKSMNAFNMAFKEDTIERHEVPYRGAFLPAMQIPHEGAENRGTIVVHGGNDSFLEEFYPLLRFFAERGHEVIAFEGPGQGAALKKHGLVLDHEWEKPTSAILDYFKLSNVTLLGISMGGWLCLRAAAFDPRITRVIPWSVSFDVLQYTNPVGRRIAQMMFRRCRNFVNNAMVRKMKKNLEYSWFVNNLMYITGKGIPIEAFDVLLQFNEKNLHSDRVEQDVLILTGREDHLVPFKMHALQVKALVNARSVTSRIFTKEEHAANHCQMGNLELALTVVTDWIQQKS
jgi:alpha-beta hydrolase superfamily lysophospholipase